MKLFFARTAYSAKSLLWISPFASYSSFVLYVKSVLPLFKIDKIDRYHHQGMSCPEVVYQAYYPYLYQRPPPVSSTATSSSANGHRNAHFSPFAAAAHHHHHHQYDRVRRYNFFFSLSSVSTLSELFRRETIDHLYSDWESTSGVKDKIWTYKCSIFGKTEGRQLIRRLVR